MPWWSFFKFKTLYGACDWRPPRRVLWDSTELVHPTGDTGSRAPIGTARDKLVLMTRRNKRAAGRKRSEAAVARIALPQRDPIVGEDGPLFA
jgi:hypothetical protein